jgi:hypothetical protein
MLEYPRPAKGGVSVTSSSCMIEKEALFKLVKMKYCKKKEGQYTRTLAISSVQSTNE